jgi:hypothetical protein
MKPPSGVLDGLMCVYVPTSNCLIAFNLRVGACSSSEPGFDPLGLGEVFTNGLRDFLKLKPVMTKKEWHPDWAHVRLGASNISSSQSRTYRYCF